MDGQKSTAPEKQDYTQDIYKRMAGVYKIMDEWAKKERCYTSYEAWYFDHMD